MAGEMKHRQTSRMWKERPKVLIWSILFIMCHFKVNLPAKAFCLDTVLLRKLKNGTFITKPVFSFPTSDPICHIPKMSFYPLLSGFNIWKAVLVLKMLLPSGGGGEIAHYRIWDLMDLGTLLKCWADI